MDFRAAVQQAFAAFAALFLGQLLSSRLFKPRSEDRFIVLYWVVIPMGAFAAARGVGLLPSAALASYLLFFVLASSWVASYPVVYASAPTLVIVLIVRRAGAISFEDLKAFLGLRQNSSDRIEDAVRSNLIRMKDGRAELTDFSRAILRFYRAYRRALGLRLDPI